jgi:ABC-2 type transport system ATP-binding protein
MSAEPLLRLEELTVRYGAFTAVDRLSLELHPGEVFGLLGPNGAGKSSTIRTLIGQRPPTAGRITLAGLDAVRDWQALKPLFGYAPDRENHFDELSGWRNLEFFADLYDVPHRRIDECLGRVELSEAAHLPVRHYSLGMRRKLLLARALLHRPRLLYLDEPCSNLDVHSAALVRELLAELRTEGAAVLLTTHDLDEVERVCDRVGILRRGRLIACGTPRELAGRHAGRTAETDLEDGSRRSFDLDEPAQREELARRLAGGEVLAVRTHLPRLRDAFLELTARPDGIAGKEDA